MLAVIELWESGSHTDNIDKYLSLVFIKLGMDAAVFYLCCQKVYKSFLSICSLSIILADLVMMLFMATLWFLGTERSLVSPCFLLSNASSIFGALPLPMMSLGLLDYCLEDTFLASWSTFCKILRNVILTLLVWIFAVTYAFGSVKAELVEIEYMMGVKALVCEVKESTLITYFILGLLTSVICIMLPFWSMIPRWVIEADRLSDAREEKQNQRSDFLFTSTKCTDTKRGEEDDTEERIWTRPQLWLSLTLGFSTFWMPYLTVSAACLFIGFEVPAYITVNLFWLECTNSLLVGLVFWLKSKTLGPYSHLPDNVCLWRVYWHLSKGMQQQQLPVIVFNPSKGKRNTLLYV